MAQRHIYVSRFAMLISPAPRICVADFSAHSPSATYGALQTAGYSPVPLIVVARPLSYFRSDAYMLHFVSRYRHAYCVKNT